jgi:hypothetical protein
LRLPAGSGTTATIERMLAPSAHAKRRVTLGGRTYGATETGQLPAPEVARVRARGGKVTLSVPGASAALVTVG